MSTTDFDLVVLGAGPGGYVAAIRAAQNGLRVACVEKDTLGGTCLNVGCIPSKALLDSSERFAAARHDFARHGIRADNLAVDLPTMMKRKDEVVKGLVGGIGFLFRKNKVEHLHGTGSILAPGKVLVRSADGAETTLATREILLATGSVAVQLPGFAFDETRICSSTGGLSLPTVPRKLIVVGGGYIGVELGSVWARLGSEVLVLEFTDGILPTSDREMANALLRLLEKQGLRFRLGARARSAEVVDDQVRVRFEHDGTLHEETVDRVLVSVGRRPLTDGLNLDAVGVKRDARGFVVVDAQFRTSVPGIRAIGDVIGGIMLAHKAEEEGVAVADLLAGKHGHVHYDCCPAVVYTHPELASVGLTEEQARQRGNVKLGKAPLSISGRARGMGETDGLVKVIADAKTDRLLGVHVLAPHASDMIHEAVAVMQFHGSAEDLARLFHAHPTLPEVMKQAAMAVDGRATGF